MDNVYAFVGSILLGCYRIEVVIRISKVEPPDDKLRTQRLGMSVDWYADPQPIPPGDREKSRCGRCRGGKDSKELGRLLCYPSGNLHEKCAEAEQADDDAYRKSKQ